MKLAGRSPYNTSDEMHKVLARHSYRGHTQAEAKTAHTKVQNKMLTNRHQRGGEEKNVVTPALPRLAVRKTSHTGQGLFSWSKEEQVIVDWRSPE